MSWPTISWQLHPRKTKQKKPENIGVRPSGTVTFRYPDGSTRKARSPGASAQPTKIPDSVIRVSPHLARGIEVAHPAVFPVDLVSEILGAFSDAGDLAFEPFCGQRNAADRGRKRWSALLCRRDRPCPRGRSCKALVEVYRPRHGSRR
jgi:hypothetical protein